MKLREHPLLSNQGLPSWPPLWVCLDDEGRASGEDGNLTKIIMNLLGECRISLRMNNGRNEYVGHLLLDDQTLCLRIYALLRKNIGKTIKEIGDLEL